MLVMGIPDLRIDPSKALDVRGTLVHVMVGPEPRQRFTVHEGVFISTLEEDEYYRLSREKQEDGHECIILINHSPATFKVYVNWLYRRRIPIPVQAVTTSSEEDVIQDEYVELAKAYNLGCDVGDFDFMDAVMDAFMVRAFTKDSKGQNWAPGSETVNHIQGTVYRDNAIEVLRDLWMRFGNHEHWGKKMANVCKTFAHEIAQKLLEFRKEGKNEDDILKDTCEYHFHLNGPCYRHQLTSEYMYKISEDV